MNPLLRPALLALTLLPALALAQRPLGTPGLGLEFPARATAGPGRFSSGAYVSGNFAARVAPGTGSYAVQPYVRYLLGRPGRVQPFIQYNFTAYRVQAYGSMVPVYTPGGAELPANPSFAPLGLQDPYRSPTGNGLGVLSVGVPVRLGPAGSRMMLNVSGNVLGGLLR